jgi:toxin ParE1/3/4
MAQYRVTRRARADLAQILATSVEHWGEEGKRRYSLLIAAGMRKVAAEPEGLATKARDDLSRGVRSFHLRNVSSSDADAKVKRPVHLLYYQVIRPSLVEIVGILHERTEPARHIGVAIKPLSRK